MPDIRFLAEQRENVLAIVLTHAHEDHIGAIGHLWPMLRCPLYATPFTARLIEGKLEEAGLRDRVRVKTVPLGGHIDIGPFAIDFISITHSIPEPNALAIRTPLGVVVHTGDWKIDPDPMLGEVDRTSTRLQKLGDEGVLATVCDSTNALVQGHSGSEARVRQALTALIGSLKGRVAVTAFASNVARLDTVAKAAREHGRQIALVGRSMHKMVSAARETGYLTRFSARLIDEHEAAQLAAAPRALSLHRQPGRTARCAAAHRRWRSSDGQPGPGRCGDLLLAHHSRQRTCASSNCTTSSPRWASKC